MEIDEIRNKRRGKKEEKKKFLRSFNTYLVFLANIKIYYMLYIRHTYKILIRDEENEKEKKKK